MSEEARNKIEELQMAIGALGELLGAQRESFMANGFTREEAMALCNTTLLVVLSGPKNVSGDDHEI